MGKIKYVKCPRCDLNYMPDTEEMCDVCKAELGLETSIVLLDDIMDEEEPLKLCPVCKTAYISLDEDMCESCLALSSEKENDTAEPDEDSDEWRTYLDDEEPAGDDDVEIPLDELEEEFHDEDDEDDEEEDIEYADKDDFEEIGDIDDIEDIDDEDEENRDDLDDVE